MDTSRLQLIREICVLKRWTNPAGESQSWPQGHSGFSFLPGHQAYRSGTDTEVKVYKLPPLFVLVAVLGRLLSSEPASIK